jgi:2-polyprenyl-3-methyl-5-hydroxy-6-metoxy-1,4-benzoquinol methylase
MPPRAYHEAVWEAIDPDLEPSDLALRRRFLLAHVSPGQRVLDVGCGEGRFAAALLAARTEVVAADIAEEPLRRAAARVPGLELRLLPGEADWALPDASFDVVWAGEVIEHVADTAGWLSEARRVLRSGGTLLISTPDHGPLTRLRMGLSGRFFAERLDPLGEHLRLYTRASLGRLLAGFRFREVSVRGAGGWPGAQRVLLARAVRERF